uniref:Ig-like domain-containing protein n=1 Tax=Amphilophus citrinellus TaxID=61819 RepID=A0A3Q0RYK5_AMPCI
MLSTYFSVILPKPSISMVPVGEVTWGQDISITCSISTQHLGGTFTLQQISGSFRKTQISSRNSATFNIPQVNFNNEGSYQCQYQTRVSSRNFSSPQMILPKPSISMFPVGDVTWSQDVSITCSISTQHLGGTFTLQQISGSFRKTVTSSTNSATFNIPQVTFNNEGSYQCQYQTRVSNRDFTSPQSDPVRVSLTDTIQTFLQDKLREECFSFLVAVMVLGSVSPPLLLLLLVLPVVFLVFRRRKQARMPEDLVRFQMISNNYTIDGAEEDHYISFNQDDTKMRGDEAQNVERAECEEDRDHQQSEKYNDKGANF